MQFTATGTVADVLKSQTMEAKSAGDLVYVLGIDPKRTRGLRLLRSFRIHGLERPQSGARAISTALYRAVERAISAGICSRPATGYIAAASRSTRQ